MRLKLKALASAALLAACGSTMAITIGGLTIPVNSSGASIAFGSVYENAVTAEGQTLSGYGEVGQITGMNISELCAGCELTYTFGGYKVESVTATEIRFSGGWINFYLGFGSDVDFNPFTSASSAADLAAASNGTLFLTLAGHAIDADLNTFVGQGINIGTPTPRGSGDGLADVDMSGLANGNLAGGGAIANSFFDTNTVAAMFGGSFADIELGSNFGGPEFLPPHPGECPGGASCLVGSASMVAAPIPEPETYALLLAGLGAIGFMARRRRP